MAEYRGWSTLEIVDLDKIVTRESNWNQYAWNELSGAGGIFQALPFSKTGCQLLDAICQVNWGLNYIQDRYGNSINAWNHELYYGWY